MSGATIYGPSGALQIGNSKPPLVLTGKGTVYTRAKNASGDIQLATSVADVPSGLVAFRPGGPMALMRAGFMAGTAPVGTPIDYWTFGGPSAAMLFGPGVFKSYDAAGNLIFSDAMNPMRYAGQGTNIGGGGLIAAIQARLGNQWRWEEGAPRPPNVPPTEDEVWYGLNGYATAWQGSGSGIVSSEYNHSRQTTVGTQTPDQSLATSVGAVLIFLDVSGY